jgi:DNA-binding CsgD family transcriptional regulator
MGSRPHSDARARSRPWQRTRQRGADLPVISSTSPLIERDRELSLFEDILGADAGAGSQAVVIEGPAGIGKSRLIAELRERAAEHGFPVLAANGSDLERAFPFGVVRQLFDPIAAAPEAAEELFAGAAAPARSVFAAVTDAVADAEDVSFAALHGLYWLTVNAAADGRLMVIVDDLHWCDRPSLRFLAYLSRRLGARPRSAALQGAESLTASERRVAALAADGRSNKEIAQALYVTPKTVEVHLSNAYRKLSIRSRLQLAVALSA